ncbi:MAG: HPF/RaiA family ribosome-associated protein [Marinobacter sp.]|uniref:HPF/RaiA family ribosome-associated protein n=1 Tax=Marinobacter sp. TaxID=50741 RepID=UPI00299F4FB9|nr:HPF/RaiA family ribosome-associated protein [Marinobacter sp.]MDX1634253.1 HPF/RaiA family ribosome-associated protein [Marinobacter sp.]
MQIPLELKFDGVTHSQWIEDYVRERAAKLDRMCDNLMSCRVVVERAQHHHNTGNPYRARVEVTLPPKKDLVADKQGTVSDPHVQLRPVIRKAFEAMEKQIKKETARRNGAVKVHDEQPSALVVRMFPDQDYGFIKSPTDGTEYYFHRNAVLHDDFDRLTPGTEVRFEAEMGDDGPQASTVQIINKPGARPHTGAEESEPPEEWQANPSADNT